MRKVGWGGWTRTNTVLINSEVPYRLDHAPTLQNITTRYQDLVRLRQSQSEIDCVSAGRSTS